MGEYYYVNTRATSSGIYLVHTAHCPLLASRNGRCFLGTFYAPLDALRQAKKYYAHAEGCKSCCPQRKKKREALKKQSTPVLLPAC